MTVVDSVSGCCERALCLPLSRMPVPRTWMLKHGARGLLPG